MGRSGNQWAKPGGNRESLALAGGRGAEKIPTQRKPDNPSSVVLAVILVTAPNFTRTRKVSDE